MDLALRMVNVAQELLPPAAVTLPSSHVTWLKLRMRGTATTLESQHGRDVPAEPAAEHLEERGVGIGARRREVVRELQRRGRLVGGMRDHGVPDGALGEGPEVEARDDAEVVCAAFEGAVERWVVGLVGLDDGSVPEDGLGIRVSFGGRCLEAGLTFVVDDAVAGEAVAFLEKG